MASLLSKGLNLEWSVPINAIARLVQRFHRLGPKDLPPSNMEPIDSLEEMVRRAQSGGWAARVLDVLCIAWNPRKLCCITLKGPFVIFGRKPQDSEAMLGSKQLTLRA